MNHKKDFEAALKGKKVPLLVLDPFDIEYDDPMVFNANNANADNANNENKGN